MDTTRSKLSSANPAAHSVRMKVQRSFRSRLAAFSRATARASVEMSVPTPRAPGRSIRVASRMAPEPVPRSMKSKARCGA
ncbi:hypothetical protein D3C72_2102750 [compost metagenome]